MGAVIFRPGMVWPWPSSTNLDLSMMALAVQQIVKDGYGILPVPIEFQQSAAALIPHFVTEIVEGLEKEERDQWEFDIPQFDGDKRLNPDHGLCNRSKSRNPNADDKLFFHWRAQDELHLRVSALLHSRNINTKPHEEWFRQCNDVWWKGLALAMAFTHELDFVYNLGLEKALLDFEAMKMHVLRILYYQQKAVGKELASPHFDFGAFTVCLYESLPGVYLGEDRDNRWIASPGQVPIFGGRKSGPFTRDLITSLAHGVEADQPGLRTAVVFFAHVNGPMSPRYGE